MTSNNKTSLLVSSQLPAFVREEHETFVKFLEYYYRFLEQDGQQLYVAKNFTNYLNIDILADHIQQVHNPGGNREYYDYHAFLQEMYDTYIRYIPDSVLADKTLILKHAKEFYRSAGSEKSVRFLIQALFNKQAEFYYPKTDILRASDGKWFIEKSLKVTDVKVNNVSNSIAVLNFGNTFIKGTTSNATAIVEKVDSYYDKGTIIYELKLSNIYKEFVNNEKIETFYTEEGVDRYLSASLFSGIINSVRITSAGSGYEEGTTVPIISSVGSGAQVIISKVSKGTIQAAGVVRGGAGFKINDPLLIYGGGTGATGIVDDVDESGFYHPNSYNVMWTTIELVANNILGNVNNNVYETWAYSNLNIVYTNTSNLSVNTGSGATVTTINLSSWVANSNVYFETQDSINVGNTIVTVTSTNLESNVITISPGLPGNLVSNTLQIIKRSNVNTTIANATSFFVYSNCGPAYSLAITNGGNNYIPPISITISANSIISKMGILGRMQIINGGTGYTLGDTIEFLNTVGSAGSGAIANVKNVAANGMITEVRFEQMPGHIIGGQGYDWFHLPSANVISATGSNANIAVTAIIGHNEEIVQSVSGIGAIQGLTIVTGGTGYSDEAELYPYLDFTGSGDGTANALLFIVTGAYSYPGRYVSDDGLLSSYNFLEDRDYYQEFSYVVRVDETINKYRSPIKDLIHPAGMKMYGQYITTFDKETATNTNVVVTYANTESATLPYKTLYQVQDYTSGVFSPNVANGYANAEYVIGSYTVNTTYHSAQYTAQSNFIIVEYESHGFDANDYVFLQFEGEKTWANLGNSNYVVTESNVSHFRVTNPLLENATISNTGSVRVYNPDVMISIPHSRPAVGENVYLIFKTNNDDELANGYYYVTGLMSVNTFNITHPNMTMANTAANGANLITKKIIVTANNHGFNVGDEAYVLLSDGDTPNTRSGYYTVNEKTANTFNVSGQNVIFSGSTARVYQKRSNIVIPSHPLSNGEATYIAFTSGDQANTVNGIYYPVKTGSDKFTINVARPATGNSNVRVWYQSINYSNIRFTTLSTDNHLSATDTVYIEFFTSSTDLANGIYMIKDEYSSNTYNIYYDGNTYIENAFATYGSIVTLPNSTTNINGSIVTVYSNSINTINAVAHSGLGIVANSVMEGIAYVSSYK